MSCCRRVLLPLLAALLLSLCGCREELYSSLSESDANEMISTLLKRGVNAQKVSEGKGLYSVTVDEEEMVRALDIIREHNLPRAAYQDLGKIFTGQAMISSQLEEQSRLAFGISQELSATFSKITGVLDSRVHVVLVQHEQSSGVTTPPSAAVFIRHLPDSPVVNMVGEIKETAARAVPGLSQERVSVMLESFREKIIPPAVKQVPWYNHIPALLGIGAAATLLLVLLVALVLWKLKLLNLSLGKGGAAGKDAQRT